MLEYIALLLLTGVFLLMTPDRSSSFAGKMARKIGPRLAASRKARTHLKRALPDKTDEEYNEIIAGMWENLGRVIAEYPELDYLAEEIELSGVDYLRHALEKNGQVILFSGHIGNWEVMAPALLKYGIKLDLVYRAPNNPRVDKMLDSYRSLGGKIRTLPKSHSGTRQLVEALRDGHSIGILIDQKYNEGVAAPFFGHPAMTSPAFVSLAQKYDCPLVPFRVERVNGIQLRLNFYPPLKIYMESGESRPVLDVIADAHNLLERWITERPDQWLWLHRRWMGEPNTQKAQKQLKQRQKVRDKSSQPQTRVHRSPAA